jgi:hypothetical protein
MWGCWFMAGGRAAFAEWRIGGKMEFLHSKNGKYLWSECGKIRVRKLVRGIEFGFNNHF